jgi:hypothetical protein
MPHPARGLLAVVALAVTLAGCAGSSNPSTSPSGTPTTTASGASPEPTYTAPPATLPTTPIHLTTAAPPWPAPILVNPQQTAAYVAAAGLPYSVEMLQIHYHAHLDINVNGNPVTVPQYLGFVAQGQNVVGLAPLHTHDASGIIHIENSVPATFVLGQVFVEWGVKFTSTCLGPYCPGHGKVLEVFVDGKRYAGDPTRLVLAKHQEIAVEYGTAGSLPTPPASYAFPAGL